jgi:hypothetical protein
MALRGFDMIVIVSCEGRWMLRLLLCYRCALFSSDVEDEPSVGESARVRGPYGLIEGRKHTASALNL